MRHCPMRLAGVFSLLLLALSSPAEDQNCANCAVPVEVTGEFSHFHADGVVSIVRARPGVEDAFPRGNFRQASAVVVSQLPPGKYSLRIGMAEVHFTEPRQRIFNVAVGDKIIATNYDIVAAAGGADKVSYLTSEVEHAGDALRGPLTIRDSQGGKQCQEFNTFSIEITAASRHHPLK